MYMRIKKEHVCGRDENGGGGQGKVTMAKGKMNGLCAKRSPHSPHNDEQEKTKWGKKSRPEEKMGRLSGQEDPHSVTMDILLKSPP